MALTINLTGVEPAFAKNTAFNKNFGTSSGDILLLGSTSVASKVLVTDSNNKVKTSSTTETQLSYLDATSSIQTQLDNKVPYTGATSDVNLGEFGIQLGNLEFDNTPTNVPTGAGSLVWNDTDGTLDLKLKGGNVTLQVGQEQVTRVVNKTATNITLLEANYQAVRITGAQGQRLKVDLALATTDALSAETIGLVTETIANNQQGFITTSGLVREINTTGSLQGETWADGDILYLSGVTAGQITNVKPTAPIHLIVIGYVVHSHITQGTIYVKVDNGYELNELHNVLLTSSADKDILAYENSTSLWKNKSASTLGIAELASPTFTGTVVLPATTSIGNVSDTEIGYLDNVTSSIQTQINTIQAQLDESTILAYQALGSTIKAQTVGLNHSRITAAVALTSQALFFVAVYLTKPQTITGVKWWQAVKGNYTASNYNGVGLYSYSGGTITLVASSTNDGTTWQTANNNTIGIKAFSSTYSASAGIYYVAFMYSSSAVVTGTQIGVSASISNINLSLLDFTNNAKLVGSLTAQTSLPSTQALSVTTTIANQLWIAIY